MPGDVVPHIDRDRSGNRPRNLCVLDSQRHKMALVQLQQEIKRSVEPIFSFDELLD